MIIFVNLNMVDIVVFDTETTGLSFEHDHLLSIGWIKIRISDFDTSFEVLEHCEHFVRDDNVHNTEIALSINHITDEFRHDHGEPIETVIGEFKRTIQDSYAFAYNVKFDYIFIAKYDENAFDDAYAVGDIMNHDGEPVINCLQRIVYSYGERFDKFVFIKDHLHTAYDDVAAELVILLYDLLDIDVEQLLVQTDEYEPEIPVGKHKHKLLSEVIEKDPEWIKWFLFSKESAHENYLRHYILTHYTITLDPAKDRGLLSHVNSFFTAYDCDQLIRDPDSQ